ncbi:NAD-dependent dehydratase [Pseudomonas sp. TTU2014-105ASC]|nr:NAD-dependent dehydratase [Pseudomonas sp. TTU2014-105ASC]
MSSSRKVLVTGGTGFVGRALLARLVARDDLRVLAWTRRADAVLPAGVVPVPLSHNRMFAAGTEVEGLHTVVHCAARVHVMDDDAADPLAEFRRVNVDMTLDLARSAVELGARRFIFLSSIKVNGEATQPGQPFTSFDVPQPCGAYALSKHEAEVGLREIAAQTGLEVVIIRTPLVYGPGVRANFRSMMRWLAAGVPLPLGALDNRRSLVALDNLVDLIDTCIDHPAAANQTLLVSDGEDMSTSELLRRLAQALGRPARLLPVPSGWIGLAARLSRREAVHARLCGSLQVDIERTRQLLGWSPPVKVDAALRQTALDYLQWRQS